MKLLTPIISTLLFMGCGDDDKPTAPSHELVGTWSIVSTDIGDALLEPVLQFFRDAGLQGDALAAATAEFETLAEEVNQELQEQYLRLRIKDGGQWEDSFGATGTWEVDGNLLTFCKDGDEEIRTRYFLSTNELVLNFSLLEIVELTEDFDDDYREFFAAVYEEDASFQIIFRRVE